MLVDIKDRCPVCGKIHNTSVVIFIGKNEDLESYTGLYNTKICESCKKYKDAYIICAECGLPVGLKQGIHYDWYKHETYCDECKVHNGFVDTNNKLLVKCEIGIAAISDIICSTTCEEDRDFLYNVKSKLYEILGRPACNSKSNCMSRADFDKLESYAEVVNSVD